MSQQRTEIWDSAVENAYAPPSEHTMMKRIGDDDADDDSASTTERETERIAENGIIAVGMHAR